MPFHGDCNFNYNYSCATATQTLKWIRAIIDFITPYTFFWESHVVNFLTDRLWEAVDKEWIDCLRNEPVEYLIQIPSGFVKDHWPSSLKKFITTSSSLAFPREQADLKKLFPNMQVALLNNVITQGMNHKKKHEIEALAAVVSSVARDVGSSTVIDVGAGQGYLSQVLSFEYQLSVIAIDASSHHGRITHARAERIKKHYDARMRKTSLGGRDSNIPKTVTCCVLSSDMLKTLFNSEDFEPNMIQQGTNIEERCHDQSSSTNDLGSLLLTGLHACGDLSVTMLRTFLESEEVKAVISIGCCYNLLSEGNGEDAAACGFPISRGVKSTGVCLSRSSRDLACQSADRWRGLEKDAGLHNFELHAFRAAFQMVLSRYFPETLTRSPTIGRQGKALRRRQQRPMLVPTTSPEGCSNSPLFVLENSKKDGCSPTVNCCRAETGLATDGSVYNEDGSSGTAKDGDKCSLFVKFSQSGMHRLNLNQTQNIDFGGIWKEAEPFSELIGAYWSLRATMGPVLETLILLDRLLFLQEEGNEAVMVPIFDPRVSPRNMALIAAKV